MTVLLADVYASCLHSNPKIKHQSNENDLGEPILIDTYK